MSSGSILKEAQMGILPDVLGLVEWDSKSGVDQSHCRPFNGFLSRGRPIVANEANRLIVRRPDRCVHFGTDLMVAMLEWVGRKVNQAFPKNQGYQDTYLLVGDISAPRGGCLRGRGGRRGHASHTNGLDVDLGFLTAKVNRPSPHYFSRKFHAKENWWLLKQIFSNPYACVRKVFWTGAIFEN